MILLFVLYATLASTFVFAKASLAYAKPVFIIAFRMTIAGLLLLVYHARTSQGSKRIEWHDMPLFLATAIFHIYLAFVLEFWALQDLTSIKTNLMYTTSPFIAALLSYFLLRERLSKKQMLGMVIGFVGLLPVILIRQAGESLSEVFSVSLSEVALMVAITSAAYAWFLVKKLMNRGYGLITINGVAMLVGGALAALTSSIVEVALPLMRGQTVQLVSSWADFLFWVGLLIVFANIIVYNLYGHLLKHYSLTFVSSAGFLSPIFGAFFGWLLLGETIGIEHLVAFLSVSAGLYLFYQDELRSSFSAT